MYTVAQVLKARVGEPVKPMRVLVVKTKERDGRLDVGLADKTGAVKAYVFHGELHKHFKEGKGVLLRNYTIGSTPGLILVNKKTSVKQAPPLPIPEANTRKAQEMVDPVATPNMNIATITTSDSNVTIMGTVVQVS